MRCAGSRGSPAAWTRDEPVSRSSYRSSESSTPQAQACSAHSTRRLEDGSVRTRRSHCSDVRPGRKVSAAVERTRASGCATAAPGTAGRSQPCRKPSSASLSSPSSRPDSSRSASFPVGKAALRPPRPRPHRPIVYSPVDIQQRCERPQRGHRRKPSHARTFQVGAPRAAW